jgi:MFS family permease
MPMGFPDNIISRKEGATLVLLFTALTWWFIIPLIIDNMLVAAAVADSLAIWVSYYTAILVSGIIGALLSQKISRTKILCYWTLIGVITSILPAFHSYFSTLYILVVSILFGISFGLGIPSALAYFTDSTLIENRGRSAGIILMVTNLIAPLFALLFGVFDNIITSAIVLTAWRAFGFIAFALNEDIKGKATKEREISFKSILSEKAFLLYFVAWLMFCLVDRVENPILSNFFGDFNYIILSMGPIIGGISALIGGLLMDWVGRKRIVLFGFATLGFAYALISIIPGAPFAQYFYLIISSISTGMLWVVFITVIWGDLAKYGSKERYFAIGSIPLFLSSIVQEFTTPYITEIPETNAFTLATLFLFVAVLPLLVAPETLPEKKMELKRLRSFAEEAQKMKEKYEGKN